MTKTTIYLSITALMLALLIGPGCGGGGSGRNGDGVAPVLSMVSPSTDSSLSDQTFISSSFDIELGYSDVSPMSYSSFKITLSMDGDAATNITSYFSVIDADTIKSSGLNAFTKDLVKIQTNDVTHVMSIVASIKDDQSNQGSMTSSFTVTPGENGDSTPPLPATFTTRITFSNH